MTNNEQSLAPCPFCGIGLVKNNAGLAQHPVGAVCIISSMSVVTDYPKSVERWNTRAAPTVAAGLPERLLTAMANGELQDEGGSDTVEAMSLESFDKVSDEGHDLESYTKGYCDASYAISGAFTAWLSKAAQGLPEPVAYRYHPNDGLKQAAYTEREAQALAYDANPAPLIRLDACTQVVAGLRAENESLREAFRDTYKRADADREYNLERRTELAMEIMQVIGERMAAEKERDTLRTRNAELMWSLKQARIALNYVGVQDHLVDYDRVRIVKEHIDALSAYEGREGE